MSVETNRKLGGIGSILSMVSVISTIVTLIEYGVGGFSTQFSLAALSVLGVTAIFGLIAFIGFVLFLVAMYGFSKDYADRRIFSYIIYGIIGSIITGLIVGVFSVAFTISSLFRGSILTPVPSSSVSPYTTIMTAAFSITSIVWVYFIVKSYNLLGDKSQVSMFKTGAKILFAGVILIIVLNVVFAAFIITGSIPANALILASTPGGFFNFLAQAIFAKSFFAIKPPIQSQTYMPSYSPTIQPNIRYCPSCGAENQTDSVYCIRCGRKL